MHISIVVGRRLAFAVLAGAAILASGNSSFADEEDGARATPTVVAQSDADVTSVERDCKTKGMQFWDCSCIVAEFRTAWAAEPNQSWMNLMGGIYSKSCFDREKARAHYANTSKICKTENLMRNGMRRPLVDCECFADRMADKVVETKPSSYSAAGKLQTAAANECAGS